MHENHKVTNEAKKFVGTVQLTGENAEVTGEPGSLEIVRLGDYSS